jgi:Tfp pilus assembly protein PilX
VNGRRRGDEGTVLVLTLGLAVLVVVLVLVVAAATELHLQRMRLGHLADELALDAADALDLAGYYAGEATAPAGDRAVALADGQLRATVRAALPAAAARARLPEAVVITSGSPDGFTARVTVQVVVHPMFGIDALLPFADGIVLSATSDARATP